MPSRKQRKNPAQRPGLQHRELFPASLLAMQHPAPCLLGGGPQTHSVTGPRTGVVRKLQGVWGESRRLVLRAGTGVLHLRARGTFVLSSPRPIACSRSKVVFCLPDSLALQNIPTWVSWASCVPPTSHSAPHSGDEPALIRHLFLQVEFGHNIPMTTNFPLQTGCAFLTTPPGLICLQNCPFNATYTASCGFFSDSGSPNYKNHYYSDYINDGTDIMSMNNNMVKQGE